MDAPFSKIIGVVYDHYLILEFENEIVRSKETNEGGEIFDFKNNIYHIGVPKKNRNRHFLKLKKLLEEQQK